MWPRENRLYHVKLELSTSTSYISRYYRSHIIIFFSPSYLYRPNAHFIRSHILSITITTTCTSMFIVVSIFTTKALALPLPGKVLHPHLATFNLTILSTVIPSIHLIRHSPVQVFVFITVKFIIDVVLDDIPHLHSIINWIMLNHCTHHPR